MPGTAMGDGALFQGMRKESAAFRLMKQMGWEEGSGLGKNNQGIKSHVRVKKKEDNAGVGANATHDWTFNTKAFDDLLKNLKVQVGAKQEVAATERKEENDQPEESTSENSADDRKEELKVKVKKVSRPQGRYKKIERGKNVQNYSEKDLKSILGIKDEEKVEELTPVTYVVAEKVIGTSTVQEAISQQNDKDWWGTQFGFVRAGLLGEGLKVNSKSTEFTENDQEKLYKNVKDKATKGRGGLGIADRPKKIAGARWQGQKISFGDADDGSDESEQQVLETVTNTVDVEPRKRKRTSETADDGETKVKLKKLCREFLLQLPEHKSSLRKLHKHVVATVGSDLFSDVDKLTKKLSRSSKFFIDGKNISLATS